MTQRYPNECLLRPPIEFTWGIASAAVGTLCWVAPNALLMLDYVGWSFSLYLYTVAYFAFRGGFRILRYQRGIKRTKLFVMSASELPESKRWLYLGQGFRWTQKHTQRLADLNRTEGRRYLEPSGYYNWARRFEFRWESNPVFSRYIKQIEKLRAYLQKKHRNIFAAILLYVLNNNAFASLPDVGGEPSIHAVGLYEGESAVTLNLGERVGHMLVLGTTRVGKTRLASIIISQDIARGDVVVVFDPKGDADLFLSMYQQAKRYNRLDNFYFFSLGMPELSARHSPIEKFVNITEVASRLASKLPGEGQAAAFRDFVWGYLNAVSKAESTLGNKLTYSSLLQHTQNVEPLVKRYLTMLAEAYSPDWKKHVDQIEGILKDKSDNSYTIHRDLSDRDKWVLALYLYVKEKNILDDDGRTLVRIFEYPRSYYDRLIASLVPLLEKLTTGAVKSILSPDRLDPNDTRPIFSWDEVIRTGGIVYVGLDGLTNPEIASVVGASMFADLTSQAGVLYNRGKDFGLPHQINTGKPIVSIHGDEFNSLLGPEFIPLINRSGGIGYRVTAYTQTWSDVEAGIGNAAMAGQIGGNFNSMLMLRVRELATAELLTKTLPKVEVNHLMSVSRANDSADIHSGQDFSSSTEQRNTTQPAELIHPSHIIQLPKGQCFAQINGGQLYKIRLPLPDPNDIEDIPNNLIEIADAMKAKYTSSNNFYHFTAGWENAA